MDTNTKWFRECDISDAECKEHLANALSEMKILVAQGKTTSAEAYRLQEKVGWGTLHLIRFHPNVNLGNIRSWD